MEGLRHSLPGPGTERSTVCWLLACEKDKRNKSICAIVFINVNGDDIGYNRCSIRKIEHTCLNDARFSVTILLAMMPLHTGAKTYRLEGKNGQPLV